MNRMTGIWMWPSSIRIHGAEKVVSYCARSKVTDIYFLAKGLAGTTSFRSSFAPSDSERDLLQELLNAAHAAGIRVHAWFTSASDEHYKGLHPESGRYHFSKGPDKGLIALSDEGYIAYMEQIIRELLRNYDVDGLHLDYIRYNHLLYGWSDADKARYAAAGADVEQLCSMMQRMFYGEDKEEALLFDAYRSGDPNALALARVRRDDVVHFARKLASAAREARHAIILSAALMPEGAYDDVAFSDLHYGQNYEDAAQIYDYVLPMAYSKAYDKDSAWVRMVAEGTMKRGMKTIVGLHAYQGGTGLTLRDDIAALDGSGAEGICLFREGACVFAYVRDSVLTVYNPMMELITSVTVSGEAEDYVMHTEIAPGEENSFLLPFPALAVRAFCGDDECSVFLTNEN